MVAEGSTADERAAAADALASTGPPPAFARLLMLARALVEDQPRVQAAVAAALGALLEDPRPRHRNAASHALSMLRIPNQTKRSMIRRHR